MLWFVKYAPQNLVLGPEVKQLFYLMRICSLLPGLSPSLGVFLVEEVPKERIAQTLPRQLHSFYFQPVFLSLGLYFNITLS